VLAEGRHALDITSQDKLEFTFAPVGDPGKRE